MGINNGIVDKAEETGPEFHGTDKSTGLESVKNIIADKMHNVAETLRNKMADQDTQSGTGQYGKQASEWLDQSAEYVRKIDYKQADTRVREYVEQSPGRSLLIAGGVGLIIGVILRRR